MNRNLLFLLLLFSAFFSWSQDPVRWSSQVQELSEDQFEIIITADIDEKWNLYSQYLQEGGAYPTEFIFMGDTTAYELIGKVIESKSITKFDPIFQVEQSIFKFKAEFKQRLKVNDPTLDSLLVGIIYQACDDQVCIFREIDLTVNLNKNTTTHNTTNDLTFAISGSHPLKIDLKNQELLELSSSKVFNNSQKGSWQLFVLGFLGGLIALLTPCVFPMIPLTVSFFTKQSNNRRKGTMNAIWYGLFIVGIYWALSLPFHFLDSIDPEILNTISTNIVLNVLFFVIFIAFAFSFFGFYELTLPSSWANKMDSASSRVGGIIGIFFMALTLAIVSFSCTGPILGSLLAGSLTAEGGAFQLTVGMTGFGLALALPFALFALFPNMLQVLPKSGGWMTTTKVVLGFLELALAFKFLSNADLVGHWGILKREIFIGIWFLIFIGLAVYLFGKWRFPHEPKSVKISKTRMSFAIMSLLFALYLIPGLLPSSSSLKLLSGFPPPTFYSVYPQDSECPLGLTCYKDYEEGLEAAKAANKPILLDFTGWACVNCRKVEENVWSDPEIFRLLNEQFILVSLYVDDRKELAKEDQLVVEYASGKKKQITTIGQKWATFQAINFETASQPYYVMLHLDGTILGPAQQYTDVSTYKAWLKSGLEVYQNQ
jgi:thiol:disulfide interchange protein DsbD